MDQMVLATQQWLNLTYTGKTGYTSIPETGTTGWTTIYALLHALQIELGITSTADNFGPGTISKFQSRYPNGVQQQADGAIEESNVYGIIQGALWCKGYSTGSSSITKHFYGGTGGAIQELKLDAGIINPNSTVTLNVMIALLSMNQYKLVYSGTENIRTIQQNLNRKYESYIRLAPCDGLYGREMNKVLIIVLQAIEGYSVSAATGNFGDGTKANLPLLPDTQNILPAQKESDSINLIRYALCCNGYLVDLTNSEWNLELENAIRTLQADLSLPINGMADINTWMSLLLSKGNPDRACTACDTRFEITSSRAVTLKNLGYNVIGRYLTGGDFKELRINEPQTILNNGLYLFPIFQESGTDITYFTEERAKIDAVNAVNAARKYGIPSDNIIYFTVDTDPQESEISSYILPYFKALSENISESYKVGIYGTRNVCTQVMENDYAVTCFVSDMSTGYSGNMGFKMPNGWNFDQFAEISMDNGEWAIDKDAFSCNESPVTSIYPRIIQYISNIRALEDYYITYKYGNTDNIPNNPIDVAKGVTNLLRQPKYGNIQWYLASLAPIDNDFIAYVKNMDIDLYNSLYYYFSSDSVALADGIGGLLDLGHIAATIEGYIAGFVPDFWFGWGGDLASLMKSVDTKYNESGNSMSHYELALSLIGERSAFGYADICSDSDSIKLADMIKSSTSNGHALSESLETYYTNQVQYRYSYYIQDIGSLGDLSILSSEIETKLGNFPNQFLVLFLGENPTIESFNACCDAFAKYITDRLPII